MKVHILEELGIPRKNFVSAAKDHEVSWFDEEINNTEIEVIVSVKTKLGKDIIEQYPNLKIIALAFTGYDSVDLNYCREKNIAVCNVPAYSTNSVAELTIALAISLLREISKGNKVIREGQWNLGKAGNELYGKTVGICGTGTIGIRVAEIFKVLGCNIIGWSRTQRKEFIDLGGKYVDSLEELCGVSDILSIHVPANSETKGLIGEEQLNKMKSSAYLINTARGPIIDEKALIKILQNRSIAGAGLDVYEVEPISNENPLLKLDNVTLTPHIAFKTKEALIRRAEVTINNINDFDNDIKTNRVD
ncbi:MAG: hydroxyacid dehydrogenase [Candidatus Delongbacteria bacterium]|nr:hydroxyacid dehydrogenase [Candidatus Delongbacteria bacterium]